MLLICLIVDVLHCEQIGNKKIEEIGNRVYEPHNSISILFSFICNYNRYDSNF
jgi:hypothetical protein